MINNEYIENNINDLHEILNEKEEIINNKNKEIIKIKEEQNNQINIEHKKKFNLWGQIKI